MQADGQFDLRIHMNTVEPAVFDSPDVISAASGLLVVRAVPIRWRVEVGRTRQVSISQSDAGVDAQEGVFGQNMARHSFGRAGTSERKEFKIPPPLTDADQIKPLS